MDNLAALRGMNSSTVDLIATDPPFNTGLNREGKGGKGDLSCRLRSSRQPIYPSAT